MDAKKIANAIWSCARGVYWKVADTKSKFLIERTGKGDEVRVSPAAAKVLFGWDEEYQNCEVFVRVD